MSLTDTAVRLAKPRERAYRLSDGRGLCLLIQPNGSKWWRFRYRFQGTEKMLSLGIYPDVPLSEARDRREAARKTLATGTDPSADRKEKKATRKNSFQAVAEHWLAGLARHVKVKRRAESTYRKAKWLLESFIFPDLGDRPIGSITAPELLTVLKKIEGDDMHESARRAKQRCGQVFRHAIGLGYATRDITLDLRGLLEAPIVKHRAAITDENELGAFLVGLDQYEGWPIVQAAFKFLILTMTRPGDVRGMKRTEVNFEKRLWCIPGERMKMREPHDVPLSRQALAVLKEVWPLNEEDLLVFPSLRSHKKPLSENAFNSVLRNMGYPQDKATAHGFRATASTILNSRRFDRDVIEAALAHQDQNEIRRIYNRSLYMPERTQLMQDWADLLDSFKGKKPARQAA